MTPRNPWTAAQLAALKARYADERTDAIAKDIGRSLQSCYTKARELGLKKSATYLASPDACRLRRGPDNPGIATRFQPGQTSWNKGTHYAPAGRSVETQFKPGNRTGRARAIYKPIGTERISKDGYLERKINDDMPLQRRWRGVHILLWEAEHGPLPPGHALIFKDGDKTHIALGNLLLITRADLMRRNSYHNYPKDIAELIQLRGALVRKINRAERIHQETAAP